MSALEEIHSLWEKKNSLQHKLIDPDFVSFGQAFNTELHGPETLKHGSRFSLMAFKTVGKSLLFKPNIGYNSPLSSPVNSGFKKTVQLKIFGLSTNSKQRLPLTRKDRTNIIALNVQNEFDSLHCVSTDNHQRTAGTQTHCCDLGDMTSELHLNQYI